MVTRIRCSIWPCLAMGLLAVAAPARAQDGEGVVRLGERAGVVRISDQAASTVVRGQTPPAPSPIPESTGSEFVATCPQCGTGQCEHEYIPPMYEHHSILGNNCVADWLRMQNAMYRARNKTASAVLAESVHEDCKEKHAWARCKFGYFVPTGCGGAGCPPLGHYSMVYPVNPYHFDQRDGQVYAASGYGGPVSVPLAPVVHHTYNYGWGIPSSRLTPISHPTSPAR